MQSQVYYPFTVLVINYFNILQQSIRSTIVSSRLHHCPVIMSSTQEYKEARVQYWEEMLGFQYNTNSTKFRAFTACKALCDHVDAMKAAAAYYTTDYQICESKALQRSTDKFFDNWASQLWPNQSRCPGWLHDNGVDRLRVPRDSNE
jgi:hypothetical protein